MPRSEIPPSRPCLVLHMSVAELVQLTWTLPYESGLHYGSGLWLAFLVFLFPEFLFWVLSVQAWRKAVD